MKQEDIDVELFNKIVNKLTKESIEANKRLSDYLKLHGADTSVLNTQQILAIGIANALQERLSR